MNKMIDFACREGKHMINFKQKDFYTMSDLWEIVCLLRSPGGCPWDREQTHESIRRNFIEEVYELVEAIDNKDSVLLKEELGDVLLQVMFHTCIEEEEGRFTLDDVADGVSKKLIFRHPHIFGNVEVSDTGEVLSNWEELKRIEKGQDTYAAAVNSVARSLPSLWRAEKMQKKAKRAGFDWPDVSGALDKLHEETNELTQAVKDQTNIQEELGDLLFSAVNVARFVSCDPEEALHDACEKFAHRFELVEKKAKAQGKDMKEMSLEELDALWEDSK